jgi:ABC-type transport system involved in multi-copper enzyme maturation permease subunit
MMLAGEFIAKEFANGSIKLAFTSPINRLSIFFGKFLSLVAYYFLLLFSYLFFFFLIVLLLKYGFRAEIGNYFYEGEYLRILLAYVVIDMSYLALAFLLATISDFVESTIFYNLATIMFLQLFSLSLTILVKSGALTDQFSKYLHKYNYIQTTGVLSFEKMEMYISGKFDKFPVSYEYLFNNFLYTCLFLVVAAWLFQKRDTLA